MFHRYLTATEWTELYGGKKSGNLLKEIVGILYTSVRGWIVVRGYCNYVGGYVAQAQLSKYYRKYMYI